jgi:hypothetical protein
MINKSITLALKLPLRRVAMLHFSISPGELVILARLGEIPPAILVECDKAQIGSIIVAMRLIKSLVTVTLCLIICSIFFTGLVYRQSALSPLSLFLRLWSAQDSYFVDCFKSYLFQGWRENDVSQDSNHYWFTQYYFTLRQLRTDPEEKASGRICYPLAFCRYRGLGV